MKWSMLDNVCFGAVAMLALVGLVTGWNWPIYPAFAFALVPMFKMTRQFVGFVKSLRHG